MTLAMAAMRLSPWARRMAVDAIAGRRPPFSVGEDWELTWIDSAAGGSALASSDDGAS
jgi:hypothetical protein